MKITKHIKLSDRPLKGIFLSDKLVVRTDLLLSPAERGVVEVGPDANHSTRAVEEQPGQHQQSPPPLAGAAKHKQDVDLRHVFFYSFLFLYKTYLYLSLSVPGWRQRCLLPSLSIGSWKAPPEEKSHSCFVIYDFQLHQVMKFQSSRLLKARCQPQIFQHRENHQGINFLIESRQTQRGFRRI